MSENAAAERLRAIKAEKDALEAEERAIYRASLSETDPSAKVCPDSMAEMLAEDHFGPGLEFPLTVHGFAYMESAAEQFVPWRPSIGRPLSWVSIRPCAKECAGRTYLGLLLGDLALSYMATISRDGILQVGPTRHNPAIYVPDLRRVVFGCESWWGAIKSPDRLREITDADINSVWYVRALHDMEYQYNDAEPLDPGDERHPSRSSAYASHRWVGGRADTLGDPPDYVSYCAECGIENAGDPAEFPDLEYPACDPGDEQPQPETP